MKEKQLIIDRSSEVEAMKRYMRQQKQLRTQHLATTDLILRAEITRDITNIDHQMKAIRRKLAEEAMSENPVMREPALEAVEQIGRLARGEELVPKAEKLVAMAEKWSRGGKWAAGIAAAAAVAMGGWALSEHSRRKEKTSSEKDSPASR